MFQDDFNEWCFEFNDPMFRFGTEWIQTYDDNSFGDYAWTISFNIYATVEPYINSVLDASRFLYWKTLFAMDEFKSMLMIKMTFVLPGYGMT